MEINKIYNEDCLQTMRRMEAKSVDIVLTSPPYNTNVKANSDKNTLSISVKEGQYTYARYDGYDDSKTNEEYCDFIFQLFTLYGIVLKENGVILWNASYGNENANAMFKALNTIIDCGFCIADVLVWKKKTALPNSSSSNKATRICEFVFVICRKEDLKTFKANKKISSIRDSGQIMYNAFYNFIEAANNDESNPYNKAAFSSELVLKLLNLYAKKESVVYDSFMGTGTTAIGAIKYGCYFIGSELSKNQVDYANKRIKEELSQLTLF